MTLRLAILGDSIAYGTGAARTSDTVGPRLAGALTASGRPAQCRIFAVPGAVSAHLAAQVAQATNWKPDLAVIIIGANDLTHFVPPQQAAADLAEAVRTLRRGGTHVVVAPAPDLSVLPYVPPAFRDLVRAGSAYLRQQQTRVTLAAGGRVADTDTSTSPAFASNPALFSADRFHPSSAGYELIAAALTPAVHAAAQDVGRRAG